MFTNTFFVLHLFLNLQMFLVDQSFLLNKSYTKYLQINYICSYYNYDNSAENSTFT